MAIAAASQNEELCPVARHIARAAARLFAARGFDATSVREIVEAAGVAKPTLYYYFGSKELLAQALITALLSTLGRTLEQIVLQVEDPVNCLEQVIEAHYSFCREDPDRADSFMHSCLALSDQKWAECWNYPRNAWRTVRRCIAPACGSADPSFEPCGCVHDGLPGADRHFHARLPVSRQTPGVRPGTTKRA